MTKQVNHFINGRRTAGRSGRTHAVYDPASNQVPSISQGRMRFVKPSLPLARRSQNGRTPRRCVASGFSIGS
jgi:hypothetical protein